MGAKGGGISLSARLLLPTARIGAIRQALLPASLIWETHADENANSKMVYPFIARCFICCKREDLTLGANGNLIRRCV